MPKVTVTARSNSEIHPLQPSRPACVFPVHPGAPSRGGGGQGGRALHGVSLWKPRTDPAPTDYVVLSLFLRN